MALRIGMTNQKGGVGKTANTINLAGALAQRGHDVLALDMDPQGQLTYRLGHLDAYEGGRALYDCLLEPQGTDPNDAILEREEFDLLPSGDWMFLAAPDLYEERFEGADQFIDLRLRTVLDNLDGYDYILVDSPPSLDVLNDNVLLATDGIYIPVEADTSSKHALRLLLQQVETLEADDELDVDWIEFFGCLVSNVDAPLDNEQKRMLSWYEGKFDGVCPVYEIRNRAAIKRALDNHQSIFAAGERSDMEQVYEQIASDLEDRHA